MSQYRNGLSMTVTAQTHYSVTTARTIKTALLCSQPLGCSMDPLLM